MQDCKPSPTLMEAQCHFDDPSSPILADPSSYRILVGRLVYFTVTRPDLSFAVNCLSQHIHEPRQENLDAALHIVRYLKGTPLHGISLSSNSNLVLNGYSDSDWASCPVTRQSTTGYITLLGSSPLSWKTKKQLTVSCSSAKAEY
ncbi:PREDICTED: uncharacterized protein LOC109115895 [Nelumbo nucifera]|nr:PREDICTED: uncharacterized protein LOC109115895 [Nelumbo nucifera]